MPAVQQGWLQSQGAGVYVRAYESVIAGIGSAGPACGSLDRSGDVWLLFKSNQTFGRADLFQTEQICHQSVGTVSACRQLAPQTQSDIQPPALAHLRFNEGAALGALI